MAVTEDHVREALKQVVDPELFVNVVDLGLVYKVELEPFDGSAAASAPVATGEAATTAPAEPAPPPSALAEPPSEPNGAEGPQQRVKIEMTLTSPACPAGPQIIAQSKQMVGKLPGIAEVEVKLVMVPPWTPDCMTDDARDQLGIF